jgi:hypothetical protein
VSEGKREGGREGGRQSDLVRMWIAREIAMIKWCFHHCQKRSAPLRRNWEMLYQRLWHGAERNGEIMNI